MLLKKKVICGTSAVQNQPASAPGGIIRLTGTCRDRPAILQLRTNELERHILCLGGTGSGKTNLIKSIFPQLKSSLGKDDIMFAFDPKRDYRRFHSKDDYVISNRPCTIAKNVGWNIFADVAADGWGEEEIRRNSAEIAKVIFRDAVANSGQPFFPKAARELFAAVTSAMTLCGKDDPLFRRYLNNKVLLRYLDMLDADRLAAFVGSIPSLRGVLKYVGSGKSDQALGVFAELQEVTASLGFCRSGNFSIRSAHRKRGGKTIFLEYDPSQNSGDAIYRLLADLFLKESISSRQKKGRIYFIADEMRLIYSDYMERALNFGRSLGLSVIAGLQSMEQLYELYGEHGGNNIASGFQSVFCFRTNNAASREYIKKITGKNFSTIRYIDSSDKPKEELKEGYTVEDWDFATLRTGEAIAALTGRAPFLFRPQLFAP